MRLPGTLDAREWLQLHESCRISLGSLPVEGSDVRQQHFVSSSVAPNSACHEFVLANVVNTGPVVFARFQGVTLGGGVGVRRAVYGWGGWCV